MGEKLIRAMRRSDLTQSDLALRLGISKAMVSGMCNGIKTPSAPLLKRMAEVLDCKMEDLI